MIIILLIKIHKDNITYINIKQNKFNNNKDSIVNLSQKSSEKTQKKSKEN